MKDVYVGLFLIVIGTALLLGYTVKKYPKKPVVTEISKQFIEKE